MEYVRKGFRRVKNRIVNRPSAVQKRDYLKLRAQLDPLRKPSDSGPNRPVLMISGITMRGTGIFCNLLAFLRWVDFAQRMGYIPVIDMQNVENLYLEDELLGRVNAYEYFTGSPRASAWRKATAPGSCISSTGSIARMISRGRRKRRIERRRGSSIGSTARIGRSISTGSRRFTTAISPSDEAAAFVDARFRELIAPGERTLGPLCRGTDYFTKRPYKHQIQPTVAQIIEKTDETLAAHPVDKIFVATEDEAILAALKAKYGGKLVYVECPRLTAVQGQSVAEGFAERGVDRKLNGLYYFASIAILARCDHLIAGKTMATQFIRTMRDTPFETEFYWDLGRYGVDDVGKRGM